MNQEILFEDIYARHPYKYKGAKFWAILAKAAVVFGIVSNLFSMIAGV